MVTSELNEGYFVILMQLSPF